MLINGKILPLSMAQQSKGIFQVLVVKQFSRELIGS